MDVSEIIMEFSLELKRILGDELSKIILYGSYARGDNQQSSDADIMILVKLCDEKIKFIENEILDCAFEFEMKYGIDISPIIKNEEHYNYWADTLPFYRNIEREGVILK